MEHVVLQWDKNAWAWPPLQEFYGWCCWEFNIGSMAQTNHIFPPRVFRVKSNSTELSLQVPPPLSPLPTVPRPPKHLPRPLKCPPRRPPPWTKRMPLQVALRTQTTRFTSFASSAGVWRRSRAITPRRSSSATLSSLEAVEVS